MGNIKTNLTVPLVEEGIFTEEPMQTHYTTGGDLTGMVVAAITGRHFYLGETGV